jgi:hypothetical protein
LTCNRGNSGTQTLTVNASLAIPSFIVEGWEADSGAGTTTNGASITGWVGAKAGYTMSIVGTAPTLATGATTNGSPAINFGGAGSLKALHAAVAALVDAPDCTMYVVTQCATPGSTGGIVSNTDGTNGFRFYRSSGGSFFVEVGAGSVSSSASSAWQLHEFKMDHTSASNTRYYVGHSLQGASSTVYTPSTTADLYFGQLVGGNYFVGQIAGIYFSTAVDNDTNRGLMETYSTSKWGV